MIKMSVINPVPAKMSVVLILSVSAFWLYTCSTPNNSSEKEITYSESNNIDLNHETPSELTPEQESALDALNTLQVSTDQMNRLYSTFAGIVQSCYPPDTSLTISQSELLIAMKQFVANNCQNLTVVERDELAATSVLAQKEYKVSLCLNNSANVIYENGVPRNGTWVLPSVLGRRDVIIVW